MYRLLATGEMNSMGRAIVLGMPPVMFDAMEVDDSVSSVVISNSELAVTSIETRRCVLQRSHDLLE